jgi:hypothetical protein
MSGSSLMLKPLPAPVSEFVYASVAKDLGLENLSAMERVRVLADLPFEDLLSKVSPALPLMPVMDGDIIPGPVTFSQIYSADNAANSKLAGKKWCESLLVGNCQADVSVSRLNVQVTSLTNHSRLSHRHQY